jgi:hypothetical protein
MDSVAYCSHYLHCLQKANIVSRCWHVRGRSSCLLKDMLDGTVLNNTFPAQGTQTTLFDIGTADDMCPVFRCRTSAVASPHHHTATETAVPKELTGVQGAPTSRAEQGWQDVCVCVDRSEYKQSMNCQHTHTTHKWSLHCCRVPVMTTPWQHITRDPLPRWASSAS